VNVLPQSTEISDDGRHLDINWPGDVSSRFDSTWLRFRNPSDQQARMHRRSVYLTDTRTWGAEEIAGRLRRFPFAKVIDDDKTLHDFLLAVCIDGIAVITGGPLTDTVVEQLGTRIGLIQATHFGRIFEVNTKADASNMAYASSGELPLHTDFPSLTRPPELQMLSMLKRANQGGQSIFVDGFRIAEQLREEYPDAYRTLTSTPIEYIEEGFDVHEGADGKPHRFDYDMTARHRVISLDQDGKVNRIQFGNAMRSWFYDVEPEQIIDVYSAMKLFTRLCYEDQNKFQFTLEDGDTVLWANTRLLHARTAFDSSRRLLGCYFGWDFVKSRIRVIRDQLDLPENQPSA